MPILSFALYFWHLVIFLLFFSQIFSLLTRISLKSRLITFQFNTVKIIGFKMGAFCSDCNSYQQELNTQIVISKDNFSLVQENPEMFRQIKILAQDQIPETFHLYQFYRKAPDTFYIGSLQESLEGKYGILYKPGQTLYYGEFFNQMIHGKGTLKLIRQQMIFKGQFNQGKPEGKGLLEDDSKTFHFNGIWKGSTKPFSGILKLYSNKTIQQIQFINFQHGDAEIYYRNGSVFKGFIDKKTLLPNGSGKMTYVSGDSYEGEWANGKFEGIGTYTWKSGEKYNGEYREGLRNGDGDFYYASGKYFKGAWLKGKRQGFGKVLARDGKIIEKGIYRNDVFDLIETENFEKKSMEKALYGEVKSQLAEIKDRQNEPLEKIESAH